MSNDSKINTYKISRELFDWSFDNPDKLKPAHIAIFFYSLDMNNRFGWKDKFGFPTLQAMEATGIKSKNTYYKAFHELVEWELIQIVTKSKNQNTANIISIPAVLKFKSAHSTADSSALDLANIQQEDSGGNVDKQDNNLTNNQKQGSETHTRAFDFLKNNFPQRFEEFQMKYWKDIENKKKFEEDFNDKVDLEDIEFSQKKLFARLNQLARNWIDIQKKINNPQKSNNNGKNSNHPERKLGRTSEKEFYSIIDTESWSPHRS